MSASRETLLSLSYKMASIGLTFVSVSLLVKNMGPSAYGAWATLASALVWIQLSDFGIGTAVRNRVASGRRDEGFEQGVATAILLTGVVGLALVLLYALTWRYVSVARDFPLEAALMYLSAFMMLPATIGVNVLQGLGLSRVTFQVAVVQGALWLALILWLGARPSMFLLAGGFSLLWAGVSLYQLHRALRELGLNNARFLRRLASVRPSRDASALVRTGGAFFVLQISGLVLFNLGTYLSYTSFSAAAAGKYDILNKVYQIPLTLFNVVIVVAWARITRAAGERNEAQLRRIQLALLGVALVGGAALLLASAFLVRPFVQVYSHGQIAVSLLEVMAFTIQVVVQLVAFAGGVFMNAVERLRMQIVFALVAATAFVPIFQLLRALGLEVASAPLSTALVVLPSALWFNVYVRRHIIAPLRAPA